MPHPNKAFEAIFFLEGIWTLQTQVTMGRTALRRKEVPVFLKPGGFFRLLRFAKGEFFKNLMQTGDSFGCIASAWTADFVGGCFLDVFWKEFWHPLLGEMIQLDEYFHENLRVPTQWMTNMIIQAHRKWGEYFSLNPQNAELQTRQCSRKCLFWSSYCWWDV